MPNLSVFSLIFACLCLGPIMCAQKTNALDKKLSGYCIDQQSSKAGLQKITVCSEAIRFDFPGFSLVSKGPLWDVVMWRQDRQQYSQVSYKDWLQVSVISASSDRYDTTKSKITESHFVRKGSKIVVYYFPKAISRGDSMLFQSQQNVKPRELRAQVDCLDWPSDIHPGAIVGRMSGLPLLRGIPMDITSSGKAYREWELRTKTFEHREDISPILFTMPPGLKKVAFSSAMFVSDDTKGVLDDYFSSAK